MADNFPVLDADGTERTVRATDNSTIYTTHHILDPPTSGGLSIYHDLDLDETGISVKGGAGQVFGWYIYNAASSVRYVKFYNKATAATVGTDTPVMVLTIPATSGANLALPFGIEFATRISVGATTGVADADTGAPAANDVVLAIYYK